MEFQVWAPEAGRVEIEVAHRSRSMQRGRDGWWSLEVPDAGVGSDYAYRVDNSPLLPDPRSPWQPHGAHGPSRVVDHSAFRWTDQGFQARPLSAGIIYELHVGTFSDQGTFDAAIEHLDHLVQLGVTHVELMPVAEFVGTRGWGYDGVDLYAPHHHYGGPEGLKRLVDACHARGLAVLLDVVYNHLGPRGNYLPQFGPYFTDRHQTIWGWAVNVDGPHSDEVRRFLCDNALMWLRDYHFDGLRVDAVHAIIDASAVHFLEQLADEVRQLQAHLGRHLVVIAESDLNDPRLVRSCPVGGYGLTAQWADDVHHAIHTALTNECTGYYCDFGSLVDLATAMRQPYVYDGRHSNYRQRRHGRSPEGLRGDSFVAFMQNHDQVGNRALGDRIGHLASADRVKIGAAMVLLSPYVPLLFQGEEWNASTPFQYFVDFHDDPALARAVTVGRRAEFASFGWKAEEVPDPQLLETYRRSRLKWEEVNHKPHADMLGWYKQLIRLRREFPCLTDGQMDVVATDFRQQENWLRMERGPITVACNLSGQSQTIPLASDRPKCVRIASKAPIDIKPDAAVLPPNSVAILGPSCRH